MKTAASGVNNKHLTQCSKKPQTTKYNPPTAAYKERARKIEKDSHNTNIFNGKNLSDNTPATNYYQVKAHPELGEAAYNIAT